MAPRVFMSYAIADEEDASRLKADLERAGILVTTGFDIAPGEDLASKLVERIESADATLVLFSPESSRSGWLETEASIAQAKALSEVRSGAKE